MTDAVADLRRRSRPRHSQWLDGVLALRTCVLAQTLLVESA
jgi:hypothetical protein